MGAWLVTTVGQVRLWQHERALWSVAVQRAPEKPRPLVNLGTAYALDGADLLAEATYTEAEGLAMTRPDLERQTTLAVIAENRRRLTLDLVAWFHDTP